MSHGQVAGPTQTASSELQTKTWEGHPLFARLIRFAIFIAPLLVSIAASIWASRNFPPERLGLNRWVWWIGLAALATILVRVLERATAKLTPLTMLFRLSLIFPDQAPSRFSTALRTGSSRSVKRRLAEIQETGEVFSMEDTYSEQMIELISVLAEHDRMTRGHAERVRAYSELIGEEMGLGQDDLAKLRWSALLHDMGKLHVPDEILNKEGRPTDEEWAILKEHPAKSEHYLEPLAEWLGEWRHAAVGHHERWDGNGYPRGLKGLDIPLSARIVAVADAFDVMTSTRSYKQPMPAELARQEVADKAGSQFDPVVSRAFLNIGLGDLRRTAGPLAWFTNLPLLRGVPIGNAITTVASSAATAVTAAAAIAVTAVVGPDVTPALAFVEPEAPIVILDDRYLGAEDEGLVGTFTLEGQAPFVVTIAGDAVHGDVSFMEAAGDVAVRSFTYQPFANTSGDDSFVIEVCDASGLCTEQAVVLVVAPVDDRPVFGNSDFEMDEAATATSVLAIEDVDGDSIGVSIVSQPTNAQVEVNGSTVTVTHDGSETTEVIFVLVANDGTSTVTRSITVAVAPVNDPPVAEGESFTATENQSLTISVESLLANDSDVDSETLIITDAVAENGAVSVGDDAVTFTPVAGFVGDTSFTYVVSDGHLTSETVTVLITVEKAAVVVPPVIVPPVVVNQPPTIIGPIGTLSIREDAPLGTAVRNGRIAATDPDGDGIEFSIVDLSNTFVIDSNSGVISLAAFALNYENTSSYAVTIVATDIVHDTVSTLSTTIDIVDINEAPRSDTIRVSVPEDTPPGDIVATVVAIDVDGDQVTYSIVGGTGDGIFVIDSSTGSVSLVGPIDFDSGVVGYDLIVGLIDDGTPAAPATSTIEISISDVNEGPSVASGQSFTIAENAAPPANTSGVVVATDPEADPVTWAIDDISGNFDINAATGQVFATSSLNFEGIASFDVIVTATGTPAGSPASATVSVDVSDVDEAPSIIDPVFVALTEDSTPGVAASFTVDNPESDSLTFTTTGGTGLGVFDVDPLTGDLMLLGPIDHETGPTYTLTIRVEDTATPSLFGTWDLDIDITDVDEAPIVAPTMSFGIAENAPIGTDVFPGPVPASDPEGQPVRYQLNDPSGLFTIDSSTGQISVANVGLDYDTTPQLNATVTVWDGPTPADLSTTTAVTIDVGDFNEAPTISGPIGTVAVDENSGVGIVVDSTLSAMDPEGNTLQWVLLGDPSGLFLVDSSSGEIIVGAVGLNHEAAASHDIIVRVDDSPSGGTNTDQVAITVLVNDMPEAPSFDSIAIAAVREDTAPGSTVGTIDASDVDGDALTITVTGGDGVGVFDVDSAGVVTLLVPVDYEGTTSYTLDLLVEDTSPSALTDTAMTTILISDFNETPVVTPGQNFSIDENTPVGTDVTGGPVVAVDPEGVSPTFSIIDPTSTFTVDSSTGVIRSLVATLDWEDTSSYTVNVTADDGVSTSTESVSITVQDVNEAPNFTGPVGTQLVAENAPLGTSVATVTANDPETDGFLFSVTGGTGSALFDIDGNTGQITTLAILDAETPPTSFTLDVTAIDDNVDPMASSTTLTIDVTNVNEGPDVAPAQVFTIVDNATADDIVTGNSGFVSATDPEGDTIEYSITGGSGDTVFSMTIDGEISLVAPIDYDDATSYDLTIDATDLGVPAVTTSASITIDVQSQFGASRSPHFGKIVFNEVLFTGHQTRNVGLGIEDEDFAELMNNSGAPVDMTGWTLSDHPLFESDVLGETTSTYGAITLQDGERLVHWMTPAQIPTANAPGADVQFYAADADYDSLRSRDDLFLYDDNNLVVAYMKWGDNALPNVDIGTRPPISQWGLWDATYESDLISTTRLSISLTPDGGNASNSGCWEPTTSDDAQAVGRCPGAEATVDRDGNPDRINSVGGNNNSPPLLDHLVISEYSIGGIAGANQDNFIEVYNPTPFAWDLSRIDLWLFESGTPKEIVTLSPTPGPNWLQPGEHWLVGQDGGAFAIIGTNVDQLFFINMNDWDYSFFLFDVDTGTVLDLVGSDVSGLREGSGVGETVRIAGRPLSFERLDGDSYGNCIDTDDNAADFRLNVNGINPQRRADGATWCSTPVYTSGSAPGLVISEVRTGRGPLDQDEFLELFNPSTNGTGYWTGGFEIYENSMLLAALPNVWMAPGESFVLGGRDYPGLSDMNTLKSIHANHPLELFDNNGVLLDSIQFGNLPNQLPANVSPLTSYQRLNGGCSYTGDEMVDFGWTSAQTPTLYGVSLTPCA